ncbi:MAG: histidine kinase, partial [Pirellulaceae bacterium]|nr:histidine kinase [Pirellulaceae bacterium]
NGDRTRLRELMLNLIENGLKFTRGENAPRIEVGVRRDGDESVYFVRDNGIGVEPQYRERIFGLFDQLDPAVEGSGIGLALAKRIVEVHGGRIWCESEGLGRGAAFCFTLPRAEPSGRD